MYRKIIWALSMICMCLPVLSAGAEDRALIIGIGKYKDSRHDLQGIELDMDMMLDVALLMGFKKHQIKRLENENATDANVRQVFREWIINGTSRDDRVLIYYSGHGSHIPDLNNDEADNRDEVLVLHDVKIVNAGTGNTLANVLSDDDLNRMLKAVPAKDILVVMDCCHSGTNTKGITFRSATLPVSNAQVKYLYYPGMPKSGFGATQRPGKDAGSYVSIAACQDNEKSLASSHGSYFTLGISEAIREAAGKGENITPVQLKNAAADFIDREVQSASSKFHPRISGNDRRFNTPIRLTPMAAGNGVVRRKIESILDRATEQMSIKVNRKCYELGTELLMEFKIPKAGYLNIVSVGADDNATVIFPNKYHIKGNQVEKGVFRLPTREMDFALTAQDKGDVLVGAFLTPNPLNLYKEGAKSVDDVFAMAGYKSFRGGFGATRKSTWFISGRFETKIMSPGCCP